MSMAVIVVEFFILGIQISLVLLWKKKLFFSTLPLDWLAADNCYPYSHLTLNKIQCFNDHQNLVQPNLHPWSVNSTIGHTIMMSFIIEGSGSSSGLFQVKQIPSQQGAEPAHFKCWIGRGLELWYIAYKVVGGLRQASTVRSHLRVHNIIWKRLSSLRHKEATVGSAHYVVKSFLE